MPRLPTLLLLQASRENPLLPLLLKECRSLPSARAELRWLRERVVRDYTQPPSLADPIARMPRQGQNMRLGKELGKDADVDAESVCVPVSVREQEGRPRRRGRRTSKTSKRKSKRRLYGRSFSQDRDRDALQVLWKMCQRRASGVPLQYILGDQPFGDLEILCQRGVLIPRADTEAYTYEAARLVEQRWKESEKQRQMQKNRNERGDKDDPTIPPGCTSSPQPLRILDLCTGTGCIALLLHALLAGSSQAPRPLQILGVDLSPTAVRLARRNREHNVRLNGLEARAREEVEFRRGDVLKSNAKHEHAHQQGHEHSNENGDGIENAHAQVDLGDIHTRPIKSTKITSTRTATSNGPSSRAGNRDGHVPSVENLLSSFFHHHPLHSTSPSPSPSTTTPTAKQESLPKIDLLISNPPYISASDFHNGTTARSVRLFEPRLALVPPLLTRPHEKNPINLQKFKGLRTEPAHAQPPDHPEDIFYRHILQLAHKVQAGITVLECGDRLQAERVVGLFRETVRKVVSSSSLDGMDEHDPGTDTDGSYAVEIWPSREEDLCANGFHPRDGSRCVIIQRR